jgi:hypothetical protein
MQTIFDNLTLQQDILDICYTYIIDKPQYTLLPQHLIWRIVKQVLGVMGVEYWRRSKEVELHLRLEVNTFIDIVQIFETLL